MLELIDVKVRVAISISSIVGSWVIAQASPVIDTAFDQLFSLGLLVIAVFVIWRAFVKKDESETNLLKEHIDLLKGEKDLLKRQTNILENRINDLEHQIKGMKDERR